MVAGRQTLYYVSEQSWHAANIVRQDSRGRAAAQLVTNHKDEAVRRARLRPTASGSSTSAAPTSGSAANARGPPRRKLAIEVHADDKTNTETDDHLHSARLSEFALSPNEKHVPSSSTARSS